MTARAEGWHVSYGHRVEYDIVNCLDLLSPENDALLSVGRRERARRFVAVDENVDRLHGERIRSYFEINGVEAKVVALPAGEENKSVDSYIQLLEQLDAFPIDRRDEPVIAIGGGVLTDLVGFAAGTYRRGVSHIRVPTTLMGYVDASIGVKTGINFHHHKNRVGSFAPPRRVLLDKTFLRTLPRRHLLNGVCEIVKLAVIADRPLFELLESHGAEVVDACLQDEMGSRILDRAVRGMVQELEPDLFEDCLARTMDFGHTFSYGLETTPGSQWLHGEAVLIDVLVSAVLAASRGLLATTDVERIFSLVGRLGIALHPEAVDPGTLWPCVEERTLHRDGLQRIPLPNGLGRCVFVNDMSAHEVEQAGRRALVMCLGLQGVQ
jgi:2-epi-5-epi-valiolone synthase